MRPLADIVVLDFTTLLPGPLATLMLAEAGATVVKIERPGGESMRFFAPEWAGASAPFQLLNRGKHCIALDLKDEALGRLAPLIELADVVVEQFRPGVMDRLGLGYEALRAVNPGLVYCAITGYGQTGPRAQEAGHDLNYQAVTGLYDAAHHPREPGPPAALVADIAGGAFPAVTNILFALMRRARTGEGARLDVAMADTAFTFQLFAQAQGQASGAYPPANGMLLTGASPRYALYHTKDGKLVAVGALEDKFWHALCEAIGVPEAREDAADPEAARRAVAAAFAGRTAAELAPVLAAADCCATLVRGLAEAVADPHFIGRGLFAHRLAGADGSEMPAAVVPVDPAFRGDPAEPIAAPALDEDPGAIARLARELRSRRS